MILKLHAGLNWFLQVWYWFCRATRTLRLVYSIYSAGTAKKKKILQLFLNSACTSLSSENVQFQQACQKKKKSKLLSTYI